MTRLCFFAAFILLSIMMILPFRAATLLSYGQPYMARQKVVSLDAQRDLQKLQESGASGDVLHKAMLKAARAFTHVRRYKDADNLYQQVWAQRSKSALQYDELYVEAIIGLGGLRRDTASDLSAVSCYRTALLYDGKHLSAQDKRIVRDEINLAVALFVYAEALDAGEKQISYFKQAVALLDKAIAAAHAEENNGSVCEANARQTRAYVLKHLNDLAGYEREIAIARRMQKQHQAIPYCNEP